jgi:hypothetical protein
MKRIEGSLVSTNGWEKSRVDVGKIGRAFAGVLAGVILLLAAGANAYEQYSVSGDDNCRDCHGDFRDSPYISEADGQSWGDSLHDVHQDMLNGDCDTCHSSGPRFPVLLGSSLGGLFLDPISCSGCHGRAEDGTGSGSEGYGAGLRQHHWLAGETICLDCHDDADPAAFDPVGEDVLPPYYSDSDAIHPLIPSDPCNLSADGFPEDYAATTIGLDNDGDDLYDEADTIDCPEPGGSLMLSTGLGFLLFIGRRRAR